MWLPLMNIPAVNLAHIIVNSPFILFKYTQFKYATTFWLGEPQLIPLQPKKEKTPKNCDQLTLFLVN